MMYTVKIPNFQIYKKMNKCNKINLFKKMNKIKHKINFKIIIWKNKS
jgi:hypothetical protein